LADDIEQWSWTMLGLQSVHGRTALVRVGIPTRRFYLNAYT